MPASYAAARNDSKRRTPFPIEIPVLSSNATESPITANFTMRGNKVNSHKGTAYLPNKDANLTATVTSVFEDS